EGGLRMLVHIEEVITAQVLVTLGMVGVHAGGIDSDIHLAVFRLRRVPAEGAVDIIETTMQHAETHVPGLEIDEGILAFLIDRIVGRVQRTAQCHQATQRDTGNNLLHCCFSLESINCRGRMPSMRRNVSSRSRKWCFRAPSACSAAIPNTVISTQ